MFGLLALELVGIEAFTLLGEADTLLFQLGGFAFVLKALGFADLGHCGVGGAYELVGRPCALADEGSVGSGNSALAFVFVTVGVEPAACAANPARREMSLTGGELVLGAAEPATISRHERGLRASWPAC